MDDDDDEDAAAAAAGDSAKMRPGWVTWSDWGPPLLLLLLACLVAHSHP